VLQLLHHTVGAAARAGSIARDGGLSGEIEVDGPPPDGGFVAALDAARRAFDSAWADDELLASTIALPWGAFTGEFIVQMYTLELTLHSWDLAVATGQESMLDDEIAGSLLPVATGMLPPEHRGGEIPFGPVVDIDADARAAATDAPDPRTRPAGPPPGRPSRPSAVAVDEPEAGPGELGDPPRQQRRLGIERVGVRRRLRRGDCPTAPAPRCPLGLGA